MRPEFYFLIILAVAAIVGSLRTKGFGNVADSAHESAQAEEARRRDAKLADDLAYWRRIKIAVAAVRGKMAAELISAGHHFHDAQNARESAECSIRQLETALVECDKMGFVTSGNELAVLHGTAQINYYETDFIKAQQAVHACVEKIREQVFTLQRISQGLGTWMTDVSPILQDKAIRHIAAIENEAKATYESTDRMLVDADRDPAGIADDRVTPSVTKWRAERVEARSKIRLQLCSKHG